MRVALIVLLFIYSFVSHALPNRDTNRAKGNITNLTAVSTALQLDQFKGPFVRKIKIAILDMGFQGYKEAIGTTLPADTLYSAGVSSETDDDAEATNHGVAIARIVDAVIKKAPAKPDYHLHLFYASGRAKLEDAVSTVIRENYDLVVFAVVWPLGGNGDGRGEVNSIIKRATDAGLVWINAAGNYGQTLRQAPIKANPDNWVLFEDNGVSADHLNVTCKTPSKDQRCQLSRIFLNWNEFTDENMTIKGTDKNLDLYIYDSKGNEIGKATKQQVTAYKEGDKKTTPYPFESWVSNVGLAPGTYQLKVKVVSSGFDEKKNFLRLFADGPGLTIEHPTLDENLLNPADNQGAIVIGAAGDPYSSRSVSRGIPQILLNAKVTFSKSDPEESSSIAAALAGGFAALKLGMGAEKKRDVILEALKAVSVADAKTISPSTPKKETKTTTETPAPKTTTPVKKPRKIAARQSPSSRYAAPSAPMPTDDGYDSGYAVGSGGYGGYTGRYTADVPVGSGNPWVNWILSLGGATLTTDGYRPIIVISYSVQRLLATPLAYGEVVMIAPNGMFATPAEFVPETPPNWYEIRSGY